MTLSQLMTIWNMLPDDKKKEVLDIAKGKVDVSSSKIEDVYPSGLSEDQVDAIMKKVKGGIGWDIGFGIADAASDLAEAHFDKKAIKNSLLGAAMSSMNDRMDSPGYVNILKGTEKPIASALEAKARTQQKTGQEISDIIQDIKNPLKERRDRNRQTKEELIMQPNTGYYELSRSRENRQDRGRQKGKDRTK